MNIIAFGHFIEVYLYYILNNTRYITNIKAIKAIYTVGIQLSKPGDAYPSSN